MCCPCMIATIPLVTGNKLNCFISASKNASKYLALCFCVVGFYFLFLHVNKLSSPSPPPKKNHNTVILA